MPEVTDPELLRLLNGDAATAPSAFPGVIPGRPKAPPIPTPPSDFTVTTDARDYDRATSNDTFNQYDKLRSDFNALPDVKEYRQAIKAYATALKSDENPAGDLNLIYAFAKIMDPNSVVREGEAAAVSGGDTLAGQYVARLKKELAGDGTFRPEYRNQLRQELQTRIAELNTAYNTQRQQYERFAAASGLEPEQVLGVHDGRAFYDDVKDYWERHGVKVEPEGTDAEGKPLPVGARAEQVPETGVPEGFDPNSFTDSIGAKLAQGFTLGFADELAGAGAALDAFTDDKAPLSAYRRERDRTRNALDQAGKAYPISSTAAEFGSGMFVGGPAFKGANTVVNAGKTGATMGALAGFGYGEGVGGSALGVLGGGLAGGVLGAASQAALPYVQRGIGALSERVGSRVTPDLEVIEAGARRGVPVRGPDALPEMRMRRAELRTSPRAGQQIRDAETDDLAAMEAALVRDLGGSGQANRARIGDVGQEGVSRARDTMRTKAQRHYTRAEKLAGDTVIAPQSAIAELDRNIAELAAAGPNANKGLIGYLEDVRADLARDGGLTVDALRSQRTGMRGQIKERNLDRTDAERRVGMVLDAAAEDINRGLASKPQALSEFRKGDQIWRDRAQFTKQIADKLIGPRDNPLSPATTAARLEGWAAKDFGRFRRLWSELDDSERSEIQGHIADSLGRDARGNFSPAFFLKHTGPGKGAVVSDKAARMVFGEEGMEAIRDLRVLSKAKLDAAAATNRSETGTVANRLFTGLRHMMLTALGVTSGGLGGAVAAPVAGELITRMGERRAVNLMLNPKFTKWLKNAPDTTDPKAIDAHFGKLRSLGVRYPAMNDNISAFEGALRDVFSQSPGRAAAETDDIDDAGRIPPQ